jgi:putative peptidoglycan lipid II flippase
VTTAGRTLARAATLIAVITVVARAAGFLRTAVFGRAVGSSCVGVVYQTANTIPNIVFDIVAGGTLAALVVPLLAPALASGDRLTAGRTVSALLTWSVLVLSALTVLVIGFAGPITRLLLGDQQCAGAVDLGRRMLIVFAPQIVLYGLAVVIAGTLQAAHRFTWPALAPLVSSLVVVLAYLGYGVIAPVSGLAHGLPTSAELLLSVGTTVGVLVLAACQLPSALALKLRLRPTLDFPVGLAPLVRRAAIAGGITLAAQQLATAVMLRLANGGSPGTLVVLTIAQAVYLVPWAVLAVPVATAVFPRLASAWDAGDSAQAASIAGRGLRVVTASAAIGTAALIAAATPFANLLLDPRRAGHSSFGPSIAAFAVGLIGWSLVAILSRILYAVRHAPLAAIGQAAGWTITIIGDLIAVTHFDRADRAVVLAFGNALGVSIAALALLVSAWRIGVLTQLRPIVRSAGAAVIAAAAGAAAGWAISRLTDGTGVAESILAAAVAGVVAITSAAAAYTMIDRPTAQLIRRSRSGAHA